MTTLFLNKHFSCKVCTGTVVLASIIQYERLRVSVKQISAFEFYRNAIKGNDEVSYYLFKLFKFIFNKQKT